MLNYFFIRQRWI